MGLVNCGIKAGASLLNRHSGPDIILAAKKVAQDIGTKNFIVDVVNARTLADDLADDEAGYNVQYFHSSEKAKENTDTLQNITYANKRAEAYAYTAQQIRRFEVGIITDRELKRQLPIASKYKTQTGSGRLLILPKVKIKEELRCSPDKADDYVMGVWGTKNVEPETDGQPVEVGAMSLVPDHRGI
jgi:hypothetical protein